ncbi:MAG: hypothetical protein F2663_07835 [Actinobacteria bacterium]|uniref:Unannotated protein n=1 Tax=freshwater metagenome TaxID=449393 RepID=A0A6J6Q630_9ZZZZ|nr:hypothetical protein [Actinomycetota bacterium]
MHVLAIVHGPQVRPELFEDVVLEHGHELTEWDIRVQGRPERGHDAVMVFGGLQNVGEEDEHPWLHDEYDLLREWIDEGTPLFGVCLGAQTLAHALGAKVAPLAEVQAGFVEVSLTAEGRRDPVLGALPPSFNALVGNGYGFQIPEAAVELATSIATPQAYRVGERAWAVQFHPEVRADQAKQWFADDASCARLPRPLDEVHAEVDAGIEVWQEHGRELCSAFLAAAAR